MKITPILFFTLTAVLAATSASANIERSTKTNSLVYGINIVWGTSGGDASWKRNDMHLKLAQRAKEVGATNTRVGITWCVIEEEKGKYDWKDTDERINFLHDQGFELVACVANTPLWATGLTDEELDIVRKKYPDFLTVLPCADEHLDSLAKWCEEFARRYKGKVKYYEIGNEDDGWPAPIIIRDHTGKAVDVRIGGDPAVYTKRLKTCYTAIKKVDPGAKVATSGLSAGGHTMFLQQIYACGGKDYFDAVAIHPYLEPFERGIDWEWLEQTKDLMDFMGDSAKKLWLTEWGYSVNNDDPEELKRHAEAIEQVLLRMEKVPYIEQASLHILNDWRSKEEDPNSLQRMGLLTYDLQPKPAFYAYKRAAHGEGEIRDTIRKPEAPTLRPPGDGEPVVCAFAESPPPIDGNLDGWEEAEALALKDSEGDQKATARILWDEKNLYLAVEVMDDYHYQPLGGEQMWQGDSVQIAFDPKRETRKWARYSYDDSEFGFCLTPSGVHGVRFHGGVYFPNGWVIPRRGEKPVAKTPFRCSVKQTGTSLFYEIVMPWSEITTKPVKAGDKIGFSIAVNNRGRDGKRTVYEFGSGITADKDPSLFRPMVLSDK